MRSIRDVERKNKMKLMAAFLLMSLSFQGHSFEVNEKGNGAYQQTLRLKTMSRAIREYVQNRFEYKNKNILSASDLVKNLKNKSDQDLINQIIATSGDIKLPQGTFENDQYVLDLIKFKIKIESEGFITGEIKINNRTININDYSSLDSFLRSVEKIGNEELAKTASFNLPEAALDLLFPSAHAEIKNGKYIDILKINSAGVIYLSLNKAAVWRKDVEDFRKLLAQIEKDVQNANEQCDSQASTVGISGEEVKVYGVLNDATRKNLQSIVDKTSGQVTEERVLAGLFTRYSARENHSEKAPKNVTCMSFLGPFGKENVDFKISIETTICPQVQKLTQCLGNLYSSDQRISNISRNEYLKKWSGDRYESDTNYLDQINTSK